MSRVLLAGTAATGEYLMYVQVGITGVSEHEGTFAYRCFATELSQVNDSVLEFYIGTFGVTGFCCK
jgi:hypothetical protein